MVLKMDRDKNTRSLLRKAKQKYVEAPPVEEPHHVPFQEQLAELNPAQRDSVLGCLDKLVMMCLSENNSPTQAILETVQDLEDGWADIKLDDDGINASVRMWTGTAYGGGDLDSDDAQRLMSRFMAEVGNDEDGPDMGGKIVWAALEAQPFVKFEEVVERGRGDRIDIKGLSYDEIIEIAKDLGFEKAQEDERSEVWRSSNRRTTSDDVCLLVVKIGGNAILLPSRNVRGIEDPTTPETCECWRCRARRDLEAQEEAESKDTVTPDEDEQPSEQAAEASTSEGD
jgi:hypothetical protein